MNARQLRFALSLATAALGLAPQAAADVAPIDLCYDSGASCDNAGPQGTAPGVCVMSRCSRATPPGEGGAGGGADGGIIVYDCLRCLAGGAGGGGVGGAEGGSTGGQVQGGTAGQVLGGAGGEPEGGTMGGIAQGGVAGEAKGGTAGSASQADDSGCDCGLGPRGSERAAAGLMLLVGLAALGRSRRRP